MHLRNKQRITLKYLLSPNLVLAVATTQAQSAGAPHIRYTPEQKSEIADQVAKIKTGNENLRSQARAIHENDNYKSVLTPDQYTQFEKMMSHRRAGGMQFRGSRTI